MDLPAKYSVNRALTILAPAGVKRTTLYALIKKGEISPIHILGRTFIRADDVRRLLVARMPPPGWLTMQQTKARLGLGKSSVFKLIKLGQLGPVTISGILYFNPVEIDAIEAVPFRGSRPRRLDQTRGTDAGAGGARDISGR
jgi:predicted DNA-binding transcriptional regulator AlpA